MPATGYKSITVDEKHYNDLKAVADQKDKSITDLVEWLIEQYAHPYNRAMIDAIAAENFEIPYQDFVLDPKIKRYQSTAWVVSKEYVNHMRAPYFVIKDRVRNDPEFHVEKMFILSRESWKEKQVWKWIAEWLIFRLFGEEQFKIYIIREKDAEKITMSKRKGTQEEEDLSQYYDMGIYGEARDRPNASVWVGYLEIKKESKIGKYRLVPREGLLEIKKAEGYFEELKKCAQRIEKAHDLENLQEQPYDN